MMKVDSYAMYLENRDTCHENVDLEDREGKGWKDEAGYLYPKELEDRCNKLLPSFLHLTSLVAIVGSYY